jgi:NAD(P)-dependent dehydrogenase (short-subunit alcohol dehydrogenase family)
MNLNNKVVIISGGASGLGEASVKRFVANGCQVAIFDIDSEKGEKLAEQLGDQAIFQSIDVTSEEDVKRGIAETLQAFGAIHICLNYAGVANAAKTVSNKGPFPLDVFERVISINLVGMFNVLRLVAEVMAKQQPVTHDGTRGVIINAASIAAYDGQIGQAAYSASKGGIVSMTLPIARDLAQFGIRVNTIAPGLILTPLLEKLDDTVIRSLEANVPYPPRLGDPDEIAKLAQAIAENEYINGETIRCDGAVRMQPK